MFGNYNRAILITHTALFIALIAAFSWISIPFIPIPITLQTLAVLLCGVVMRRYAVIPILLYDVLGAAGLPIFHNGASGIGVLLGPTGGYLIGFIPAAFIIGLMYDMGERNRKITGLTLGTLTIYLFGVGWLILSTGMAVLPAIIAAMIPFLPGDVVKATAAYLIGEQVPPVEFHQAQ